ncbi:hypothetical protein NHP190009_04160 [Helicobacter ailurogastricus]|nr:hypothetical protein NHP190009_04160 [Helicobacter ailurogastricus]
MAFYKPQDPEILVKHYKESKAFQARFRSLQQSKAVTQNWGLDATRGVYGQCAATHAQNHLGH